MAHEVIARPNTAPAQTPQHSFADLTRMADAVAKSGLFGVKTPEAALTLMLIAQEEGTGVAAACRDFHVIEGRPALKVDAMLARFHKAGGAVEWERLDDQAAIAIFIAPHGKPLKLDWTIERAKTAGLVRNNRDGSPGMWMKYPRAMLRSRLVSEGIRTVAPETIVGVYTVEELRDEPELRDVTPPRDAATVELSRKTEQEIIDVETGEILADADAPAAQTLSESELVDHKSAIDAASTLQELKKAHARGYKRAFELHDHEALKELAAAKDAAKAKLTAAAEAALAKYPAGEEA